MAKQLLTGNYLPTAKCIDFSSPQQNLPVITTPPWLCTHGSLGLPVCSWCLVHSSDALALCLRFIPICYLQPLSPWRTVLGVSEFPPSSLTLLSYGHCPQPEQGCIREGHYWRTYTVSLVFNLLQHSMKGKVIFFRISCHCLLHRRLLLTCLMPSWFLLLCSCPSLFFSFSKLLESSS